MKEKSLLFNIERKTRSDFSSRQSDRHCKRRRRGENLQESEQATESEFLPQQVYKHKHTQRRYKLSSYGLKKEEKKKQGINFR